MVLSKEELLRLLRLEIQILTHLAGKIEPPMLDYRPTPKQRSTLELLRYLAVMGPVQIALIRDDNFNGTALRSAWTVAERKSGEMTFDEAVEAIRALAGDYERQLADWTDDFLRAGIDMFGTRQSRGSSLVTLVLNAHAAYRMQLFLYLKSCGREELGTINLWGGLDRPPRTS